MGPRMADEFESIRATERAARATALINDETLNEAFTYLEAEYLKAWRNTGVEERDTMARERLWQAINLLGKVQNHLKKVISDGKIARADLDALEAKSRN